MLFFLRPAAGGANAFSDVNKFYFYFLRGGIWYVFCARNLAGKRLLDTMQEKLHNLIENTPADKRDQKTETIHAPVLSSATDFLQQHKTATRDEFCAHYREQHNQTQTKSDYDLRYYNAIFTKYREHYDVTAKLLKTADNSAVAVYTAVFGQKPVGAIIMQEGFGHIYLLCDSDEDYIAAFTSDKDAPEQIRASERACDTAGRKMKYRDAESGQETAIVIAKRSAFDDEAEQKRNFRHEEQHVIWDIVSLQAEDNQGGAKEDTYEESEKSFFTELLESLPERLRGGDAEMVRQDLFQKLTDFRQTCIDSFAANELLAYLKGDDNLARARTNLLNKGVYAYAQKIYDIYLSEDEIILSLPLASAAKNMTAAKQTKLQERNKAIRQMRQYLMRAKTEVFVKQYQEAVQRGADALEKLQAAHGTQAAIYMLINEPLTDWPKVVDEKMARTPYTVHIVSP